MRPKLSPVVTVLTQLSSKVMFVLKYQCTEERRTYGVCGRGEAALDQVLKGGL